MGLSKLINLDLTLITFTLAVCILVKWMVMVFFDLEVGYVIDCVVFVCKSMCA